MAYREVLCYRVANTHVHDESRKANTNHSVFSRECPRLCRIESIIISKTEY